MFANIRKLAIYGLASVLSIFILPFTSAFRLFEALWESRILLYGMWSRYNRFNMHRGLNSLFYWTEAINIDRFSLKGISPYIGIGNYPMKNFWFAPVASIYIYWRMSCPAVITSLFLWLISHLVWSYNIEYTRIIFVVLIILFSSSFYAQTFELQNYNAIGWIFFPIFLYSLYNEKYLIASISVILCFLGSPTASFIATIFSALLFIKTFKLVYLIPILAGISVFFIKIASIDLESIYSTAKGIGLVRKSKYKRKISIFGYNTIFHIMLDAFAIFYYHNVSQDLNIIMITWSIIKFLNLSNIVRFADISTVNMVSISVYISSLLKTGINNFTDYIVLLILLNHPIPFLEMTQVLFKDVKELFVPPKRKPFDISPVVKAFEDFLSGIKDGSRIFFAFPDPKGKYENIFYGERVLLEPLFYVANLKNIHVFPDWLAVFQTNYEGAQNIWVRDYKFQNFSEDIKKLKLELGFDYLIVSNFSGRENIQPILKSYKIISVLHWEDIQEAVKEKLFENPPTWYLLKAEN